jgi:hypothetical protein
VRIGELHSTRGETIQIRCRNLPLEVETAHIPDTEIIGEDEDDIGLFCGGSEFGENS